MREKSMKSQSVLLCQIWHFNEKNGDLLMSQQKTSRLLTTKKVVPRVYRPEILHLAHDTLMSGHLDINKTYHKILNHLY